MARTSVRVELTLVSKRGSVPTSPNLSAPEGRRGKARWGVAATLPLT